MINGNKKYLDITRSDDYTVIPNLKRKGVSLSICSLVCRILNGLIIFLDYNVWGSISYPVLMLTCSHSSPVARQRPIRDHQLCAGHSFSQDGSGELRHYSGGVPEPQVLLLTGHGLWHFFFPEVLQCTFVVAPRAVGLNAPFDILVDAPEIGNII